MQYYTYNDTDYVTFTDGVDTFRDGSRDEMFVIDKTLTATGFAGTEDVDWEERENHTCTGATGVFRDGVRNGMYVIDAEITATGFDGTEDVDWENIYSGE